MTSLLGRGKCRLCEAELPEGRLIQCAACDEKIAAQVAARYARDEAAALEARMRTSGLPRDYRSGKRGLGDAPGSHATLAEACSDLGAEPGAPPAGFFLFGESQTFKTTIAAATLARWIRAGHDGRFVDATDLMTDIQATYRADSADDRAAIVERYAAAPALVIDDLGQEKASTHAGEVLRQILDRRLRNALPGSWLIVTSNFTPEQLRDRFGEPQIANAILHRIAQLATTIPMGPPV